MGNTYQRVAHFFAYFALKVAAIIARQTQQSQGNWTAW